MAAKKTISRRNLLKGAVAGGGALLLSRTGLASGPSGPSGRAYVLPSRPGVHVKEIITVGDTAANGYRMVGLPDGLGALDCGKTFEVFMHHEITASGNSGPGIRRAHGFSGAFVSKWTIDRKTLKAVKGEDLTPSAAHVHKWNGSAWVNPTPTPVTNPDTPSVLWERFCSADLPDEKALRHGNAGTSERIFLGGEEVSGAARFGAAWGRIVTGPNTGHTWELPHLGKGAFENVVACPHSKKKTVVALFDDGSINTADTAVNNPCEVFIYVGTKQSSGNEIQRAGLTNGKLYAVQVVRADGSVVSGESNANGLGTTSYSGKAKFRLVELGTSGDVSTLSGLQIETDAIGKNVTRFLRVEDGAWDPRNECNDSLYFVTTGAIASFPGHPGPAVVPTDYQNTALFATATNSRLWRLKFDDIDDPLCGGTIEILLSGTELPGPGWRMFDNICIDGHGRLLLQEDTGNHPWVARIWLYSLDTGKVREVAHHDPALFDPSFVSPGVPGPQFLTQDEESSGIIDAEHILGRGWFLLDVQNHWTFKGNGVADPHGLVEGGQLVALYVDPKIGGPKKHGHDKHDDDGHGNGHDHHDH